MLLSVHHISKTDSNRFEVLLLFHLNPKIAALLYLKASGCDTQKQLLELKQEIDLLHGVIITLHINSRIKVRVGFWSFLELLAHLAIKMVY